LFIGMILMLQSYVASLKPADELVTPTPAVSGNLAQADVPTIEPSTFDAKPSELAVSITAIAIGVLIVGAAGLVWWFFIRKLDTEPYVLARVAAEAEETLESLLTGKDLRETILLCYRRMTEVAVKNRGIPRDASVTPREFEQTLIEKGLPAASVRDLTRLFEDVRYGNVRADEAERRRATLALRTVIAACRKQEEPAA
jgi:hypothetical protein